MTTLRLAIVLAVALLSMPAAAQQPLPLFDAHIHYSRPDWDAYTPERVLSILAQSGIRRALVSSTPDDGTLKLYDKAPAGIVPFLRPYRTREDMGTWPRDPAVQQYVEERIKRGIYKGIGEVHFGLTDVDAPVVKRFAEIAAERNILFKCHIDVLTAEKMLTTYPKTRLLLAHAGMSGSAVEVGRLLDRF